MSKALDGIRIVDLTMWFQGPVAAQHLADLGAEVVHMESPKGGDAARGVASIRALPVGDWNQYFLVINRNKKSMAVDLKHPSGQEILKRLIENSDVFMSNLSPAALKKWGCSYEDLSAVNPRLIYAMGTGYGPKATINKPSFDMTVQALTGIMSRLGEPGEPPIYLGMGSGDAMGGIMMSMSIMMALLAREKTGKGQYLDASLYGSQLFMAAPTLQPYLATGEKKYAAPNSRTKPDNPLWNVYEAADKWLVLCLDNTDANWSALTATLDDGSLAEDSRFADEDNRRANASVLVTELDRVIATKSAAEWLSVWEPAGLIAAPIETLADMAADKGAWENRYFVKARCEAVGREVDVRGLPIGLSKTPGQVETLGPELGQDTEMILFETLGYDWDEIGKLKADGAIL
jgi:crotonobetainyl-CoA:carnitine CoA-transferase CaiB-like acyl-CoA transferase